MEALSVHAADASSYICWIVPAWLAHGMHRALRCGCSACKLTLPWRDIDNVDTGSYT